MDRYTNPGADANHELVRARRRRPSATRPGECMSRSELADAVNACLHRRHVLTLDVTATYVGKLEAGVYHWIRDDRRREAFREVLNVRRDDEIGLYKTRRSRVDGHATWDVADGSESGIVHQQRSATVALTPPPSSVGPLQLLQTLNGVALEHGWAAVHPLVAQQLVSLEKERREGRSEPAALAAADAHWSEFMSWVCDNGGFQDGQMWLSRAYTRSVEAGAPTLTAYILMRQSQQALDGGDAATALSLSRKALLTDGLPPRTQALCMTRLAESLALTGDNESLTLIGAAEQRAQAAGDQPADLISRHCDDRYVNATRARCCYLLGNEDEATTILRDILRDERPAEPLDRGMWMSFLAAGYSQSDPERAADAAIRALAAARAAQSARLTRALLPTAILLRRHRKHETVARFLDEYRRTVTSLVPG